MAVALLGGRVASPLATSSWAWLPALCASGAVGLGLCCWLIPASLFLILTVSISRGCSDSDRSGVPGGRLLSRTLEPGVENRAQQGPAPPSPQGGSLQLLVLRQSSGPLARPLPLPARGPCLCLAAFSSGCQAPWVRSPARSRVTSSNLVTSSVTQFPNKVRLTGTGREARQARPCSRALPRPGACCRTQAGPVCVRRGRQMTNVLHTLTLSCFLPVLPAPWSQPSPAPLHTASGSEPAGSSTNSR